MEFKWADGQPPADFSSNGKAVLKITGGTGKYVWEIDANDDATFPNDQKIDRTFSPKNPITVTTGESADCSIVVTVTNQGKTLPPANISNIDQSFKFDFAKTGSGTIAQNSSRTIYVSNGNAPFTWTTSTSGFYFDSARTQKQITTNTRNVVLYSNNSACGTAIIQVTDQCGAATEGSVRSSEGRYKNHKTVDTASSSEICPGSLSPCGSGGIIRNISCDNITPRYDYYIKYTTRSSAQNCGPPGCDASPQPVCNRKELACSLTVSDGICEYTYKTGNCKGVCSLQLTRAEWVCD